MTGFCIEQWTAARLLVDPNESRAELALCEPVSSPGAEHEIQVSRFAH